MPGRTNRNHVNGTAPEDGDDSDSSVDTVDSDEIEELFVERHGRRFHSHGNMYPLPVDDDEAQRLNRLHETMRYLMGNSNYFGPVENILIQNSEGRRKRVIDLCTGTGKWVLEMADEFPDVKFYGLDIVPLTTREPPDNVQFEVEDIRRLPLRWARGRFDVVHMRFTALGIPNYPSIVREAARLLRSGGVFLSVEWIRGMYTANGADLSQYASNAWNFFRIAIGLLGSRQIQSFSLRIPEFLGTNGNFTDITATSYEIDLDQSIHYKRMLIDYAMALRYLFVDSGQYTGDQADALADGLRNDVMTLVGLKVAYQAVHARRI